MIQKPSSPGPRREVVHILQHVLVSSFSLHTSGTDRPRTQSATLRQVGLLQQTPSVGRRHRRELPPIITVVGLVGRRVLGLTIIVGIVLVEVGVEFIRIRSVGTPRTRRGDPIYFSPSRPSVARVRPPSTSKQSIQQRSDPTRSQGFTSTAPPRLRAQPANSDNSTAPNFLCACAELKNQQRNDPRRRVFDTSPSNKVKTPQNAEIAPRARPGTRTGRRSSRPCEEIKLQASFNSGSLGVCVRCGSLYAVDCISRRSCPSLSRKHGRGAEIT